MSARRSEVRTQAQCWYHPSMPAGKAQMMRVSHDYHRRGALAYLRLQPPQGQDLRPGRGHDRDRTVHRAGRTGHDPGALRIRGRRVLAGRRRLIPPGRRPSTGQRRALSPNDFTDLDMIEQRLARFEDCYNAAAKPFRRQFTPPPTWPTSWTDSTDTNKPRPPTPPNPRPPDPRRTYEPDH